MNKEFKVGQRVWVIKEKKVAEISFITKPHSTQYYMKNMQGFWFENEIMKSADDMFEELGYEMFNKDDQLIFRNKQYQIVFDKGFEGYYIDRLVENIETFINTQLHQAIHQKLIELGWIE